MTATTIKTMFRPSPTIKSVSRFCEALLVSVVTVVVVVAVAGGVVVVGAPDGSMDVELEVNQDQPMMLDGSAESLAIATSNGIQCESITVPDCKQMIYNTTTMPNFFDDLNQVEANTRAKYYKSLLHSSCNPSISTYLCQLITPVCLEQDLDTMYKFKIYPCRTYCRRMIQDCGRDLANLNELLRQHVMPAFDCDRLPYEANGGNSSSGASYGPCHDPFMEEDKQQSSSQQDRSNQYRPFQAQLEDPFITDKSRLDIYPPSSRLNNHKQQLQQRQQTTMKPPPPPPSYSSSPDTPQAPPPHQAHDKGWPQQVSSFGQTLLGSLVKHSNIISIITVLVLLAALFAKRLRRLRGRFHSSSSASSSGSSSSSGCSSAPLNGTGGSGFGKTGSMNRRFTSHDHSISNSGAALPVAGYHTALARQQQIYSNILLSSPSHQVLLLDDGSSGSPGTRSKLLAPTSAGAHQVRAAPPQTRAPLPPPQLLLNTGGGAASGHSCYLSSDQQSISGYYETVPVSPYSSPAFNYDAPNIQQFSSDSQRRSSFRRKHLSGAQPSSSSSSSTPTRSSTTIQCKQQPNNMLFMS